MLNEGIEDPGDLTPGELRARYEAALADAIETAGVDAAVEASGVDAGTVDALAAGESPELTLEEAAALLAAGADAPDAAEIAAVARDDLLLGMTTAVLDVEAVESGIDGEIDAREIQQKVEGRLPMTLAEYARLRQYVESRKR